MTQCGPYKTLPVAKYKEWKVLDLRFLATGMTGLDNTKMPRSCRELKIISLLSLVPALFCLSSGQETG